MKSGPTLKGCTRRPRSFRAASSASVTVVLPTRLCVPAITRRGKLISFSHSGSETIKGIAQSPVNGDAGSRNNESFCGATTSKDITSAHPGCRVLLIQDVVEQQERSQEF